MKLGPPARAGVLALVLSLIAASCTTATIRRPGGMEFEGYIDHSDARAIYVRGDQGQLYRFERHEVEDIDHPGNVALTVGSTFGLLWGVSFASLAPEDREKNAGLAVVLFLPLAALIASGAYSYFRSKGAARNFEEGPRYLLMGPAPTVPRPSALPPAPLPVPPPPPDAGGDGG